MGWFLGVPSGRSSSQRTEGESDFIWQADAAINTLSAEGSIWLPGMMNAADPLLPEWLRRQYDFSSRYLCRGGWKIHYIDEGAGAPLLMLHGNPSWSFMYRHLIEGLRDRFRVIVPDHLGCGLSDKPGRNEGYSYTLRERVDDLECLIESLHLQEPLSLVVHDWGGPIGMAYATRHPDRIGRLVIFNTAAFHVAAAGGLNPLLLWCRNSRLAAFLILKMNFFSWAATRWGCRMRAMPRAVRRAFRYPYCRPQDRWAILRFIQDIPLQKSDASYAMISEIQEGLSKLRKKPVLICWGERDPVFGREFLLQWQRRLPQACLQRFTKGGHYLLEDAHERIVPLVREFLAAPLRVDLEP